MNNVLIVGSGAMGCGITYVFAKYYPNAKIYVIESNSNQSNIALSNWRKWFRKDLKISDDQATSLVSKIIIKENFDALGNISWDLLLEAVSENIELKVKIFQQFNLLANSATIIASNTSSLSVSMLAATVDHNKVKNVLGMHFFNPVKIMKLLEVVTTEENPNEVIKKVKKIGETLNKEVVICKDSPGFITSRLGIVFLNEAIFTLQEGLASAQDIDKAVKLGYNHPMGPLALADFIGLDVVFAVLNTLFDNYQDSKYRPCLLLRKKVELGHLGQKSGKGFFEYNN